MLIDIQASGAAGAPAPASLAAKAEIDAPTGVNWPAGAGRPGCRAGPPRRGYAQAPAVHAGPVRAAPRAWRTPTPVPDAAPDAALDATLDAALAFPEAARGPNAAWVASAAPAWRASKAPPRRPARGGRDRLRPAVAAATSAVSPDALLAARRGEREARSAPGPAVRRYAACACCATASVPVAAE